jgi:hypothetical protein
MKKRDLAVFINNILDVTDLQYILWSLDIQTYRNFEVFVVNSTANAELKNEIEVINSHTHYPIYLTDQIDLTISVQNILFIHKRSVFGSRLLEEHVKRRVEQRVIMTKAHLISSKFFDRFTQDDVYNERMLQNRLLIADSHSEVYSCWKDELPNSETELTSILKILKKVRT